MRRLTARSRLRAVLALLCLRARDGGRQDREAASSLHCTQAFLFCLAELQETRLLCSEESLMDALGIGVATELTGHEDAGSVASKAGIKDAGALYWTGSPDPRPLVMTWLHGIHKIRYNSAFLVH